MKKYQVMSLLFLFSCFATAAMAQSQREPVLHPINPATIKIFTEDDKNWKPVKQESKTESTDRTKAKEPVVKPEKEKKEKPEIFREAEKPKYNNKGR